MGAGSSFGPGGLVPIICRKCGRVIAYAVRPQFRSIAACAICLGNPEENVLPQYTQTDPTQPVIPINQGDPLYLYEEEKEAADSGQPWSGLLRPLFRALGFVKDTVTKKPPVPQEDLRSKKIARSKKTGGIFER